jgi:hypothetical protein
VLLLSSLRLDSTGEGGFSSSLSGSGNPSHIYEEEKEKEEGVISEKALVMAETDFKKFWK